MITRVSKIIHRHNKAVAELVTNKLKSTNWDNPQDLSKLASWLNGVITPEKTPDVKKQLQLLRQEVIHYEKI